MSSRRDAMVEAAGWLAIGLMGLVVAVLALAAIGAGVAIGWVVSELVEAFR